MKTLKTLINEYFEERVEISERGYHCYDSFLRTYEMLSQYLEDYGVEDVFPQWYDYVNESWDAKLIPAINKYIETVLEPEYKKLSTITK